MPLTNQQVAGHVFLEDMFGDDYYPDHVVAKGASILVRLCERIEAERPADLAALYALTQAATEEFNELDEEFCAAGSEIETVARDTIAVDFGFVASAYGFPDADLEELVATREW
ncbi:DUF5713 family protein [Actinomadura macrotermitis]|uniref:Uncharacterized protein n=1 Tax=Actinomadura macrotermitis TaxID=2585200 RepID=A0A7K0C5X6_9ACTN|nr:DUF5713 family protein [Actinomadura macrotermitis]MQY08850.1 hypothetical protein [Actinomadura macrotermitis]